jgi:hypothetical protein
MQQSATSMQMTIAFSSACIALAAVTFTVHTWSDNRNAQLVQIGVGILEIDPKQQVQVKAAREWALDLIDANAGGVRFSLEARAQLLDRPLGVGSRAISTDNKPAGLGNTNPPVGGNTIPPAGGGNSR